MEKTEGLYFFRVELLSSFFKISWNYKDCLGTVKGERLLTTKASDSSVFRNLTVGVLNNLSQRVKVPILLNIPLGTYQVSGRGGCLTEASHVV